MLILTVTVKIKPTLSGAESPHFADQLTCKASPEGSGGSMAYFKNRSLSRLNRRSQMDYSKATMLQCLNVVRGCFLSGDEPLAGASCQTMLAESAGGFASAVETRYHLAIQVNDLALTVDPEARARVVDTRR